MNFDEIKSGSDTKEESSTPRDECKDAKNRTAEFSRPSGANPNNETKTSGPSPEPEVTRDWVTRELARNTQIASARQPLRLSLKLIPRDPKYGPAIVREIQIYSQDVAAANQSLTLLGKSLAMFKGERQEKWVPKTEEQWRLTARVATFKADEMAKIAKHKEATENDK